MFGWVVGIVGLIAAAALGLGGLGSVTAENAMMLCAAFILLVISALLVVASRGNSQL